jgi:hypothetical protein
MRAGAPEPVKKLEWGVAAVAVLLILCFHVVFLLRAGALWRDEINTLQFAASPSVGEIWNSLQYDSFPVFSSLALRVWTFTGWGRTDLGLRVFGLMVGIAILAALWLDARLKGFSIPLLSMPLFAFAPLAIRFGDSIRPYGLGIVFLLVASGFIWKVSVKPGRPQVVGAALSAVLSVQCLYQNAFLLLALCAGGIAVCWRRRQWKRSLLVAAIGAVSAFSLLPYYDTLRKAQDWAVVVQSPTTLRGIRRVFSSAMASGGDFMVWVWLGLGALCLLAAGWCWSRGARRPLSDNRSDLVLSSTIVLLSATAAFLLFLKWASLLSQPWYYLPLMAVCAVSLDGILVALTAQTPVWFFRAATAILVLALSFPYSRQEIQVRQTNADRIASRLEESAQAEDLIVVSPWYYGVAFQRYYRGKAPWITVPPLEELRIHRYDLLKEKMKAADPIGALLTRMSETLRSGNRLWLVGEFPALPKGRSVEPRPPAPDPRSGWNSYPYVSNWAAQTDRLVRTHACRVEPVPVSTTGPVNPYENLMLQVAQGWQRE